MVKTETKEEIITKEVFISITCDICGKEYSYERESADIFEAQEFLRIDQVGGYGSVFGDCDRLKVDICQHCLKRILENELGNIDKYISEE